MEPIWTSLASLFEPLLKQGMKSTASWIFRRSPLALRISALALLLVFVSLSMYLFRELSSSGAVIFSSLNRKLEPTSQEYKGLESFILAGAASGTTASEASPQVNSDLQAQLTEIGQTMAKVVANGSEKPDTKTANADASLNPDILLNRENPENRPKPTPSEQYLTDSLQGFLFVPGQIVSTPSTSNQGAEPQRMKVDRSYSVYFDLRASQAAADRICGTLRGHKIFASNSSAFDDPPKQLYMISGSGVARLCEAQLDPSSNIQHAYYANKFRAATLFQDRPYFEPTVALQAQDYFHATAIYVDLGGNGFVKTFCHPLFKSGQGSLSDTIICFDVALRKSIESAITSEISHFGHDPSRLLCTNVGCSEQRQPDTLWSILRRSFGFGDSMTPDDLGLVNSEVTGIADKSEVLGKIHVYESSGKQSDGQLRFTIPINDSSNSTSGTSLLFANIDLPGYERFVTYIAGATGASLFLSLFFILLIILDFGLRFKEQQRAFKAVDAVMEEVPVPYARVDEDGVFTKWNQAFENLIGLTDRNEAESILRSMKWQDILDKSSAATYQDVKRSRREGHENKPYLANLWILPQKKKIVSVEVHGSDVPSPHASRAKPGQSFGIILRRESPALPQLVKTGST